MAAQAYVVLRISALSGVLVSVSIIKVVPVRVWKLWRSKPSAWRSWMPEPPGTGESCVERPHIPNQLLASRSLSLKSTGGSWTKSCKKEEEDLS